MKTRRLLSLVLALVMVLALATPASAETVTKRPNYAHRDSITLTIPFRSKVKLVVTSVQKDLGSFKGELLDSAGNVIMAKRNLWDDGWMFSVGRATQLFSGELPAGTYYFNTYYWSYGSGSVSEFNNSGYNGKYYLLEWTYDCCHVNATEKEVAAATCSSEGEIQKICDDCNVIVKRTPVDKLPHTPDGEWVTVQEPTCSAVGKRTQTCTVCEGVALEEDIEKLPHEAAWKTTKEATCSTQGQQNYICSVCGEVVETKAIPALEHTFGKWTITEEGDCRHDGKRVRECSVCGERETQTVDAADQHVWGRWYTNTSATCTEDGKETRACRECHQEETRAVRATGHDFGKWEVDSSGENEVRTCSVCDKEETRKVTPKKEDKPEEKGDKVSVTKANSTSPTVIVLVVPTFGDVNSSSWYQSAVTYAYNLGLMVGNSETTFNPMGNVTLAEAVTMAARARNSYEGGSNDDFKPSKVWYQTYVDYAVEKGIVKRGDFDDYSRVATRAEMAYIFAHALPDSGMKAINSVKALPDVDSSARYSEEIFKLYNTGIITGSDAQGTFLPDKPITRSEAAAIITRVTLSSERKTLHLR